MQTRCEDESNKAIESRATGRQSGPSTSRDSFPDYQERILLLEQKRREDGLPPFKSEAERDYELQLLLLEEANAKRLEQQMKLAKMKLKSTAMATKQEEGTDALSNPATNSKLSFDSFVRDTTEPNDSGDHKRAKRVKLTKKETK